MSNIIILKEENIAERIYFIRGEKVMLDFDIALLYGVETKQLKRAVKRNIDMFPLDFMFVLSEQEYNNVKHHLRYHFGTSSWGGRRYFPMAFTEQGVASVSGILKSKRAVQTHIAIMRAFVQMRKWIESNKELAKRISDLENKYDKNFHIVFEAIKQLTQEKNRPRKPIGFKIKKTGMKKKV